MSVRLRVMPSDDEQRYPAAQAEELAAAALAGDAEAWAALIERHDRKVVVALLGRGVPLERAREVAQEAWLRLMERQRAGRLTELMLPGLAIVQAAFLAANERRRDGYSAGAGALPEAAGGPTLEEAAISRERL